jgi:hypothetical protein
MRKLTAIFIAVLLFLGFATPAESNSTKWTAYQKTLATYSGSNTALSSLQKSQIRATLDKAPLAEKFICTGIRYYDQPMSINIMVRKRAKEACAYAKELKPSLSTWYQNKPTKARSYAGKVLLTVKSPDAASIVTTKELDPNICKIEENSRMRVPGMPNPDFVGEAEIKGRYNGNATAFPFASTVLPTEGVINAQMVLVDWADLPGDQEEFEFYKKNAELTEEFWFMASEGKLEVNIEITDGFLRIPGSYADFTMTKEEEGQRYETRPKKQALYDAVAEVSDPIIDYTDTQIVFPGWPRGKRVSGWGPHEFNFDWNAVFKTDERDIYDIAGSGDWHLLHTEYSAGPWVYYVHEMGHMLGIPHQTDTDDPVKYSSFDQEEYWWVENPINGFEIMANQDGAIKTLSAWLRWLPGTCIEETDVENELYALNPINEIDGGKEALVIKLTDTKVIVVESRRWDERFDRPIVHSRDGIIAYIVDSELGSGQGNQALLSPRDITNWVEVQHWRSSSEMDGNFCEGDSVDVAGINIKLESSQKGVDYVRVTSTNKYVDPETPAAGTARGEVNRISDGCVYGPRADRRYFDQQVSALDQSDHEWERSYQTITSARNFRTKGGCSCCGCSIIPG